MLDDIPAIDPPLPYPVDDEETDRITLKFAAQLAGDSLDTSTDGLRIDRYINAEVRARGGMGRVFVAYDPGLDRTVALKALPVGLLPHEPGADTPRREGIALAHIDHPNVVKVLELIEHRGLACLVLEHIDGPHLGDWLKAPRDFRDILHKFLQAGEGLAAVHRVGLVHRDFKPSNAVVGLGGIVKLIDFGLAFRPATRHPDDADERPGTPRYMAPEQIDGREVNARSDQFSFCVALYEALFRAHPYLKSEDTPSANQNTNPFDVDAEQASRATIFDQILDGTPRRPERVLPGLPSTVIAALLRGLSPKPEDRHTSMDALLEQLRRDPRRKRHRAFFAIAGVLAFSLGLFTALRTAPCPSLADQTERIWSHRRALVQLKLEPFSSASLDRFDHAVAQLAERQIEACNDRNAGDVQETDFARDACLQIRESELDALFRQITNSDQEQLMALEQTFPQHLQASSDNLCKDLVQLRYSCMEDGPSVLARVEGIAALSSGDIPRASTRAATAFTQAEARGAAGSLAQAHTLLARVAYTRGDKALALHHLSEAIRLAEQNVCFAPAAEAFYWFVKLAAFDEQIPLPLAEVYSKFHEYRISPDNDAEWAKLLNNRALIAERRQLNLPLAEELLREAIKRRGYLLDYSPDQADSYLNLASVLFSRNEPVKAKKALERADTLRTATVAAKHPDHAKHLRNRGLLEIRQGHYSEALNLLTEALLRAKANLGANAPGLGEFYTSLASAHDRLGQRQEALRAAEMATVVYSEAWQRSESREDEAQLLISMDKFPEAISRLNDAESLVVPTSLSLERRGTLDFKRAEALNGLKNHADAERYARQALRRFDEAGLSPGHERRAYASLILGETLNFLRRWDDATPPFEQAIAIWKARGDNPELLAWAWRGLADSLCRLPHREVEARRAVQQAFLALSVIEQTPDIHTSKQKLASVCRFQ